MTLVVRWVLLLRWSLSKIFLYLCLWVSPLYSLTFDLYQAFDLYKTEFKLHLPEVSFIIVSCFKQPGSEAAELYWPAQCSSVEGSCSMWNLHSWVDDYGAGVWERIDRVASNRDCSLTLIHGVWTEELQWAETDWYTREGRP